MGAAAPGGAVRAARREAAHSEHHGLRESTLSRVCEWRRLTPVGDLERGGGSVDGLALSADRIWEI